MMYIYIMHATPRSLKRLVASSNSRSGIERLRKAWKSGKMTIDVPSTHGLIDVQLMPEPSYIAVRSAFELGSFVRGARRERRLRQQELASLAGVGTRLISDLENGKSTIRLDVANRVLEVFGKMIGVVDAAREETKDSD